jgi:hypothetical protein
MYVVFLLPLTSCASVSWNTPVVFSGPSVALTEVNMKTGKIGQLGAGYQLTLGMGQFNWLGKRWDALDVSGLVLGASTLNSVPVGALQFGGELATLNGIFGLAGLSTPVASDGSGYVQGGSPGMSIAAVVNIQAIIADFGSTTSVTDHMVRLPRGGF